MQHTPSIRFLCDPNLEGVFPSPVPAAKVIPDWFKAIKPSVEGTPMNGTVKRCAPFIDALSAGFIIPMWADCYIQVRDGEISTTFAAMHSEHYRISFHSADQAPGHPLSKLPAGRHGMKFNSPWLIQTDPGISCLFTSPLNHMESRFKILDGVVDTDSYYNNVNFPSVWTAPEGEYYIPKGTPLVHVIPFRREPHTLEIGTADMDLKAKTIARIGTKMQHAYRTMFRHQDQTAAPDTAS